ncbi:hypothetical protein SAMN03159463_05948 [Mesorhizobium sp. NFR06]|nr:hypothetical protein SAMN03159463_05948 [Mesorhizobium sp. NFR06]
MFQTHCERARRPAQRDRPFRRRMPAAEVAHQNRACGGRLAGRPPRAILVVRECRRPRRPVPTATRSRHRRIGECAIFGGVRRKFMKGQREGKPCARRQPNLFDGQVEAEFAGVRHITGIPMVRSLRIARLMAGCSRAMITTPSVPSPRCSICCAWGRLNLTGAHINAVDLDARERAIGLRCGRSHRGIELLTGIAGLTRL